jgi:hypothetical protein
MLCDIMNAVCSRFLKEACDLIQNIGVCHSIGIVKTWSVDECTETAIGCVPVMDTDLRRLGQDIMSNFDSLVTSDELDELLSSERSCMYSTSAEFLWLTEDFPDPVMPITLLLGECQSSKKTRQLTK